MKLFGTDEEASLAKAVINHSKELVQEVKPTINNYINKHSNSNSDINEDEIYEEVMVEIEEDNKIKSTWAKALSQSDGNKEKAESLYIKLRVDILIQEKIEKLEKEKKEEEELVSFHKIIRDKEEKEEKERQEKEDINNYLKRKGQKTFNKEELINNKDNNSENGIFGVIIYLIKAIGVVFAALIILIMFIAIFRI